MSFTVAVSGLAELDKALGELPKATARNVLKRTLDKAAQPIVESAKMYAPVDTGKLRESIIASPKIKNKVGKAEYAAAMRAGLGKAAAGAALRQVRSAMKGLGSFAEIFVGPSGKAVPYAHIVEFGSVKDSPQPYMRPAWEGERQKALEIIKAELGGEIIKAAKRVARSKKQSVEVKYRASLAAMMAAGF